MAGGVQHHAGAATVSTRKRVPPIVLPPDSRSSARRLRRLLYSQRTQASDGLARNKRPEGVRDKHRAPTWARPARRQGRQGTEPCHSMGRQPHRIRGRPSPRRARHRGMQLGRSKGYGHSSGQGYFSRARGRRRITLNSARSVPWCCRARQLFGGRPDRSACRS